jgi:hypothetical protein
MAAMVEVEVVGRRRSVRMPAVAEVEGYRLILDGDTHQVSVQTKKAEAMKGAKSQGRG